MKIYLFEKGEWKFYEGVKADLLGVLNEHGVKLGDGVTLGNGVTLGDGVKLGDRVTLGDGVTLGDWVTLGNGVTLGDRVTLGDGVTLGDQYDCIVIEGLGSRRAPLSAVLNKGKIQIGTGCFLGTIEEFEAAVKKNHAGNDHEKQYLMALEYIRSRFSAKLKEGK